MTIRLARREDLLGLLELYTHLHAADEPLPPRSEIEALWSEMLADTNTQVFVAESADATLIASCTLAIVRNLTRGCRPYGIIENVVTHAAFRQQGYGTAVLHQALSAALERGCYKVMLLTGSKREATLRFYESAGFVRGEKTGFIARPPR